MAIAAIITLVQQLAMGKTTKIILVSSNNQTQIQAT